MKYVLGAVGLAAVLGLLFVSCNDATQQFREKNNIQVSPTGIRLYTVTVDGQEYVVAECHNGVGICKK
jgi:hypothetical protein